MSAAPVLDERVHRDVLAAAVSAAVGPNRVFDYGEVPGADGNAGTLPAIFVLLTVERTYTPPRRVGVTGRSAWYVSARVEGSSANEARWARLRVSEALDQKRFTIGGFESTPLDLQPGSPIEQDGGRYSGLSLWNYTL